MWRFIRKWTFRVATVLFIPSALLVFFLVVLGSVGSYRDSLSVLLAGIFGMVAAVGMFVMWPALFVLVIVLAWFSSGVLLKCRR